MITNLLQAQETLPIYSDYLSDNVFLVHPSAAGIGNCAKLRLTARSQWAGIEDAPSLQTISAHTRLDDNIGVGVIVFNDKNGYHSQQGVQGTFAYHIGLGRQEEVDQVSFGLSLMVVNNNVDERYHLEMATEVACEYLKESREKLGSWTLAAAAYNAGMTGVSRRLSEQMVSSYYDLLLGQETGRYVFRIVALKEILSNHEKYGFNFRDKDLYSYIPTYKVEVDTAVTDFARFADTYNINYKILKLHNPWLREPHLNNKTQKKYFIDIPHKGYYQTKP